MHTSQTYLVSATAITSAMVGGVFYAFSTFVMAGLRRIPPETGMTSMQSINVTAVRPGLMLPFFGAMLANIAVAVSAIADWDGGVSVWLLIGSLSYVLGTFVMTAAYHVPRNNALADIQPTDPDATAVWHRYLVEWTRGNHIRAASSLLGAVALAIALLVAH